MGKDSSPVVGFKYFMGLHMGVCRGPVDSFVEIRVGDRKAWPLPWRELIAGGTVYTTVITPGSGENTGTDFVTVVESWTEPTYTDHDADDPVTASSTVQIRAAELFGGEKREGGIEGPLGIMMGGPTQGVNAALSAMLGGGLVPAFRGVLTLFFDGLVSAMNPYPKPWKFRVRRALKGWDDDAPFYPGTAIVNLTVNQPLVAGGPNVAQPIFAMNGAHIIWECITNKEWGRGLSAAFLNEAKFTAAADTLFAEGFGLCFPWARSENVDAFVQIVLDHIGAVLYVSKSTGLIELDLIRADYVLSALPVFTTRTGILEIQDDDANTAINLINEVIVTFVDPLSVGQKRQTRVQNIASMQASGSVLSKPVHYLGVPTLALANRLAQRDLRVQGTPLRRFTLTFDRKAYTLAPGAVFKFSDTRRSILEMVMRVGGVVDDLSSDVITVTAVQDVFGLPSVSYITGQSAGGLPSTEPIDPVYGLVDEANYIDIKRTLSAAEFSALSGDESFLLMLGARPSAYSPSFQMYTGSSDRGFATRGTGTWSPAGTLDAAIAPLDTLVTFTSLTLPATLNPGTPMRIGSEVVRIDDYDFVGGEITVARGCADTIPHAHPTGTPIFLFTLGAGRDATVYAEAETIGGKFLTQTPAGILSQADAALHETVIVNKFPRPYPPGYVRVNLISFPAAAPVDADEVLLKWASRNRLTQADVLVAHVALAVTPEASQTATVEVYDDTGAVVRTASGITSDDWDYSVANWATDGSPDPLEIQLFSVRDGYESWERYKIPLFFVAPDTAPHAYWRVKITKLLADDALLAIIAELEFRATVGGADQSTGGTAFASTGASAANAFDNNVNTVWQSATLVPFDPVLEHVGYQFAAPVSVNEIAIRVYDDALTTGVISPGSPVNIQVQYSDDGVAYTTAFFRIGVTWTEEGQTQTFAR